MLQGETIESGASGECCGVDLKFQVLESAAGFYVGTFCPNCGPYSRESGYYPTKQDAQRSLDNGTYCRV